MAGIPGAMKRLAEEHGLCECGIHTENSDIRVHVCPVSRSVCAFRTSDGVAALKHGVWKPVRVNGKMVGQGALVQPDDIAGSSCRQLPDPTWDYFDFSPEDRDSVKAIRAQRLVRGHQNPFIRSLYDLPFDIRVEHIRDVSVQKNGGDLRAHMTGAGLISYRSSVTIMEGTRGRVVRATSISRHLYTLTRVMTEENTHSVDVAINNARRDLTESG